MVFSSTEFLLLFLPLVLLVYYNPWFRGRKFRNYALLLFSLGFYGWGEPLFIAVMLFSIFVNWLSAILIDREDSPKARKRRLVPAVIFNILLIFVFKYLAFSARNLGLLLGRDIRLNIALPIGISFLPSRFCPMSLMCITAGPSCSATSCTWACISHCSRN